ncbi:MAG: hypothetical protein ABI877_14730 [Gemmatimonadaceae bacterium]
MIVVACSDSSSPTAPIDFGSKLKPRNVGFWICKSIRVNEGTLANANVTSLDGVDFDWTVSSDGLSGTYCYDDGPQFPGLESDFCMLNEWAPFCGDTGGGYNPASGSCSWGPCGSPPQPPPSNPNYSPPPLPAPCVPSMYGCLVPLRPMDLTTLAQSLGYFKDVSTMSSEDAAFCGPLMSAAVGMVNGAASHPNGPLMMGADSWSDAFSHHEANTYHQIIHVDQAILDSARISTRYYVWRNIIAESLLHEMMHFQSNGALRHPNGRNAAGEYVDEPFSRLIMNGPNACTHWQN